MIRCTTLLAAMLALSGIATATCDGVDNCLGIYFDEDVWTQDCLEPIPFSPYHQYFVLQNCAFDAIGGCEFAWRYQPAPAPLPLILSYVLPGIEPWLSDPYNIIYAMGVPLVTTGPTVLADFTLLALATIEADLQLGPAAPASIPGRAAINDYDNPSDIVPLNFPVPVDAEGWTVTGAARLGDCEVAAAARTWGEVKALYR